MTISMIMPVYNESRLLPYHLELAAPYVDEIILIDGGPDGPSTDDTKDHIKAANFDNVKMIKGKFELSDRKGGWDRKGQIRAGVEAARGEVLIITSCDSVYDDYELLIKMINKFKGKVYYCLAREFFINIEHVRLVNQGGYALPLVGHVIFKKNLFTTQEPALFAANLVEPQEYIYLQDIFKYHYGWITDFDVQVRKHVRNVKAGGWGEYGDSILAGGDKTLEAWAITHILNYKKEIAFCYAGNTMHPFSKLDFLYLNNFDKVLAQFRKKHGQDYYECV